MSEPVSLSLSRSIASDSLISVSSGIADIAKDVTLESKILDGIPIFGTLASLYKTGRDVGNYIFARKVAYFLDNLSAASALSRTKFVQKLSDEKKIDEFGETIILLLEHAEDMEKPRIIGKVLRACIEGDIGYGKAMRLVAIVNRCYTQDLAHLINFVDGVQEDTPIAESLFAAGLISNGGLEGGTADGSAGGVIYYLNEYGELLVAYGL